MKDETAVSSLRLSSFLNVQRVPPGGALRAAPSAAGVPTRKLKDRARIEGFFGWPLPTKNEEVPLVTPIPATPFGATGKACGTREP
jgi:hypothetical protein